MTTKRRGMTEEAADAAIDQACRMLRMPTIRGSFTEYADRVLAEITFALSHRAAGAASFRTGAAH